MGNSNPRVRQVALNASGGGWTAIALTIMASKVTVTEDPAQNNGVPQGLQGYYMDTQPPQEPPIPNPNGFAATPNPIGLQVWLPNTAGQQGRGYQPISFGGTDGRVHGGEGDYVGAQGTIVLYLESFSETATGVLIEEWA